MQYIALERLWNAVFKLCKTTITASFLVLPITNSSNVLREGYTSSKEQNVTVVRDETITNNVSLIREQYYGVKLLICFACVVHIQSLV